MDSKDQQGGLGYLNGNLAGWGGLRDSAEKKGLRRRPVQRRKRTVQQSVRIQRRVVWPECLRYRWSVAAALCRRQHLRARNDVRSKCGATAQDDSVLRAEATQTGRQVGSGISPTDYGHHVERRIGRQDPIPEEHRFERIRPFDGLFVLLRLADELAPTSRANSSLVTDTSTPVPTTRRPTTN